MKSIQSLLKQVSEETGLSAEQLLDYAKTLKEDSTRRQEHLSTIYNVLNKHGVLNRMYVYHHQPGIRQIIVNGHSIFYWISQVNAAEIRQIANHMERMEQEQGDIHSYMRYLGYGGVR